MSVKRVLTPTHWRIGLPRISARGAVALPRWRRSRSAPCAWDGDAGGCSDRWARHLLRTWVSRGPRRH